MNNINSMTSLEELNKNMAELYRLMTTTIPSYHTYKNIELFLVTVSYPPLFQESMTSDMMEYLKSARTWALASEGIAAAKEKERVAVALHDTANARWSTHISERDTYWDISRKILRDTATPEERMRNQEWMNSPGCDSYETLLYNLKKTKAAKRDATLEVIRVEEAQRAAGMLNTSDALDNVKKAELAITSSTRSFNELIKLLINVLEDKEVAAAESEQLKEF